MRFGIVLLLCGASALWIPEISQKYANTHHRDISELEKVRNISAVTNSSAQSSPSQKPLDKPKYTAPVTGSNGTSIAHNSIDPTAVQKLWEGIDVQLSNYDAVAQPLALSPNETVRPPNMPTWCSQSQLPSDFIWGWATAAYQVEGAVKADNRGPSIWDKILHSSNFSANGATGDIAADHYYLFKQDAQRLKAMGVPYYSMTISWPRIFPFGNGSLNQVGLKHYIDEVDYLLSLGIEPIVTLVHFDPPQALQDAYGGFTDKRIIEDVLNYSKVIFESLGSKVRYWFTLNEPTMFCKIQATLQMKDKSDTKKQNEALYSCAHNSLLAHARIVQLFREIVTARFPDRKISYKDSHFYGTPYSKSAEDHEAWKRSLLFGADWFSKPIFIDGDYPDAMKHELKDYLPKLSDEQKKLIKGSADFYAWDGYYGSPLKAPEGGIKSCISNHSHPLWPACAEQTSVRSDGWVVGTVGDSSIPQMYSTPDFFSLGLKHIHEEYKPRGGILVSEFGHPRVFEKSMPREQILYDDERSDYYQDYLNAILDVREKDGVNVIGALGWAALDDFEWLGGYDSKLGLQYVNFTTQERKFKKSAFVFTDFFKKYVREAV